MKLIAIDGACRRNGKPDCTAAGGVFIQVLNDDRELVISSALSVHEYKSTNQRGELLALLVALDNVDSHDDIIVTDSEYIFNAMTKQWYSNWHAKGWVTASGDPVKNKDIWLEIYMAMERTILKCGAPNFYHIKGHCIPFGRVTADNLLARDTTGSLLLKEVYKKFDSCASTKVDVFNAAQDLSERNNGFMLPDHIFRDFVVANTVVDAVATKTVDAADNSRNR